MNHTITITLCLYFLLSALSISLPAQSKQYKQVDKVMRSCPAGQTSSVDNLARYVNEHFETEDQKARAIYMWVAGNIQYDVTAVFADKKDHRPLETRKGVCQDYANLFVDISRKAGLEAHLVSGYTRQQEVVLWQPHVWAVARVGGEWYFFDPTWGAGYVRDDKFYKSLNDDHFKITPPVFIKTHIPYDPFWQILENPITAKDFDKNKNTVKRKINPNFTEDLLAFLRLDDIEQEKRACHRIEAGGICNFLLYYVVKDKKAWIKATEYQQCLEQFNEAQYAYEDGVFLLNDFIVYRNNFFEPYQGDLDLKKKIGAIISQLEKAEDLLGNTDEYPEGLNHNAANLHRGIQLAFVNVKGHKEFVRKYIETPAEKREALFYD